MSTRAFRALVLVSLLSQVLWAGVDFVFPALVPPAVAVAIDNEPLPTVMTTGWVMWPLAVWAIALVAAHIGLLFFRRWARSVAFWGTLGGFALFPILGGAYSSGWAGAFQDLAATAWGAALALAYFGPIAQRFTPRPRDDG